MRKFSGPAAQGGLVVAMSTFRFLSGFISLQGQAGRSEVLASPKQPPAFGVEAKIPRISAFLAEPFRAVFCYFSKSLCGAKNRESDSLIRKRPRALRGP
jgi:hypothetical protein